jgi:hypothetical protein
MIDEPYHQELIQGGVPPPSPPSPLPLPSPPLQHSLISWLLKLACACLSFDFMGTSTDESADDLATVQIPSQWRSTFLDFSTIQLFFNLFHSMSAHELAAMVRMAIKIFISG